MARIFDVIEYPNEMADELIHRFPEGESGDFRIGSQVIVRESQTAVFFRDGKALKSVFDFIYFFCRNWRVIDNMARIKRFDAKITLSIGPSAPFCTIMATRFIPIIVIHISFK